MAATRRLHLILWAILAAAALPALLLTPLVVEAAAAAPPPPAAAAAPTASSSVNDTTTKHSANHFLSHCVMGSLMCLHDDLKPFLITALWLLFLVVLLLVFERTEHKTHHQMLQHQQHHAAASSSDSLDDSLGSAESANKRRMRQFRAVCDRLVYGIKEYLPTSCLQILLGFAFAGAFQVTGYTVTHLTSLEPGLFFHFLLPIIIINAGLGVEKRHFYFNLPAILAYAVFGTIIVALVVGYAIYGLSAMNPGPFTTLKNVSIIEALTFGSLISAVDPVAVLALFERMHLNKPLYITLFGESVLNDAVSVVLYNMFTQAKSSMAATGTDEWHPTMLEIGGIAVYSINVALTGFGIGVVCGIVASGLMRILPNAGNQNLAVLIVVVSGYISFFLAEFVSASGILSTFVCSIVMSIYLANLTPISQTFLHQSTKSYAEISEGFVYLVMGVSALNLFFAKAPSSAEVIVDVPFIFITLALCVVLRFACVYGIGYLLKLCSLTELRAPDFFILSYGGLRGAIALALSLMLDKEHYKYADALFACTLMMVLLTCFLKGISLKPLIMLAKIQVDESVDDRLWDQIMNRTCDYVGFFMGSLTGYQPLMKRVYLGWNNLNDKYMRRALLKSKVYNEAQDEGIYELHKKIVADEFLKFATENKSLIDLNALHSDSMVYAIRRVSSMGNIGMVHNQSHRSLTLLDSPSHSIMDHNGHAELCYPVLDMEALSNNLAKSERDQEDQVNHHKYFMPEAHIINPQCWLDQRADAVQAATLGPSSDVKFSILRDEADDEVEEVNDSNSKIHLQGLTNRRRLQQMQHAETGQEPHLQDQPDEAETGIRQSGYASRNSHQPHMIQMPRHGRSSQYLSSVNQQKLSDSSLTDAGGLADGAEGVVRGGGGGSEGGGSLSSGNNGSHNHQLQSRMFSKRKSVSFASVSQEQGFAADRNQSLSLDSELAEPSEDFNFEVKILDSLPWNRGPDCDEHYWPSACQFTPNYQQQRHQKDTDVRNEAETTRF